MTDKGYDSQNLRRKLRARGIKPTIPTFEHRQRKKPKLGRPLCIGAGCRNRWKVERYFCLDGQLSSPRRAL